MPQPNILGNIDVPPTPEDHRELIKLKSVIFLAKLVVWASIGFITGWMVLIILPVFNQGDFDKAMQVLPAIVPFWGTITGAVLGYLFGKKEQ